MAFDLKITVVQPLQDDQALTLDPEENVRLWEMMRGLSVGAKRIINAPAVEVKPFEEHPAGYDVSDAHTYLTEAFRGVPSLTIMRDKLVMVIVGAPDNHLGFQQLLTPADKESHPTQETKREGGVEAERKKTEPAVAIAEKPEQKKPGETMVIGNSGDTKPIAPGGARKLSPADWAKVQGPGAASSSTAADDALKRRFNRR